MEIPLFDKKKTLSDNGIAKYRYLPCIPYQTQTKRNVLGDPHFQLF